jgi:hypothetical protein
MNNKVNTKVTMLLTEKDVANISTVYEIAQFRTKAQAISLAAAVTRFLVEQRQRGAQLQLKWPDGEVERIVIPELEQLGPRQNPIRAVIDGGSEE